MCGFLVVAGGSRAFSHRDLFPMKRRGPDDVGFWTDGIVSFGQRRLAILGLDDRSTGPLENERHVLAFNGEIYNFLVLARGLGIAAPSDTRVLLEAWTRMGPDVLPRLEGFWSFAVLDKVERTITLCRDQFGIKPLYYWVGVDGLVASSTLAPLLSSLPSKPALDYHTMSQWAKYQMTFGRETFFRGVHRVLPGEIVTCRADEDVSDTRQYERIWDRRGDRKADDAWVTEARETLTYCVDEAATSDIAVTSTCSGGLDSSLVTRILAPEVAYHGNFTDPECNETKWAQAAVDGTDTRLMVVNCTEHVDLVTKLDSLVDDFDDLTVGSVILPLDDVFGRVAERFKVCLLGTGGDELFGGYARYEMALGRCPQASYQGAFARLDGNPWDRFMQQHVKGEPQLFRFYSEPRFPLPEVCGHGVALENMMRFDRAHFLPALLNIDDKIAGRHGIEGRPALLHQRFVRKVLELDPEEMRGKAVLRRIARGILPDAVIDRTDKMGFTTPVGTIVNANASHIREALSGSRFRDFYNLRRLSFTAESKWDRRIFGLLQLDCWLRRYA